MAEGGCAAAMGNVNPNDNWQVHYRDTMRGGKFLNNWRMAELHAKEAPDRVWELETYGALFDRTKDGKISQRNFGGHTYPRLAHVGDRTGLELIRTLQQKIVSLQQEDYRETRRLRVEHPRLPRVHDHRAVQERRPDRRRVRLLPRAPGASSASTRRPSCWRPAGSARATRSRRNSWEYTGDGHALALRAGATLINMEFLQFHPTGMVWPPSVKGILVTESVRGDGGVLRNSEGKRFMFEYIPDVFKDQYATTEEEGDRWYTDPDNNRRPPELLPRDEVARAINSEVKAGRGKPARRRLPRHRLAAVGRGDPEAAAVDVPPVQGAGRRRHHQGADGGRPDLPLRHGRRRGRRRTPRCRRCPACSRRARCSGGMHGSNRLGGNSLSDLLVFGRRAGRGAAAYVDGLGVRPGRASRRHRRGRSGAAAAVLQRDGGRARTPSPCTWSCRRR